MIMIYTELDIFLAHSVELESEAQERYLELAESMATHNNGEVAAFFQRMAREASQHLAEVEALSAGRQLPAMQAWEFDWPEAEPPETASYEALHYRMSLRQAMALALDNERAAERYYRLQATTSEDPETKRIATDFADEEVSHGRELERLMQALPEDADTLKLEDDDPGMPE